jgi:cytoskeletal protein RodZ
MLRRSREQRGYTLEAIATRTKIPLNSLNLIEEDRFEDLPGDIFVRGFLKSYCQALSMEDASVLEAYFEQTGNTDDVRTSSMPRVRARDVLPGRVRGLSWVIALVMLLLLGGVLLAIIFHPAFGNANEAASREAPARQETTL